jgi:hypothetical protein
VKGQLFLNTERLEHHPDIYGIGHEAKIYVELDDINKITVRPLFFLAKSLLTLHIGGETVKFIVSNGNKWKREIERLQVN